MRYLEELLKNATVPFYHASEEGAGGGQASETPPPQEPELDLPVDSDIPPDEMKKIVDEDQEFKDALVKDKKLRNETKTKEDETTDKDAEVDNEKDPGAGKSDNDGKPAEEKDTGKEAAAEIEFADNVIEGLSGKDFKAIPESAQVAIAKFHESHGNLSRELGEIKSWRESLLSDPVVKHRVEMLENGQDAYKDEGLSLDEKSIMASKLSEKFDLTGKESAEVIAMFGDTIDTAAKKRIDAERQNYVIEHDRKVKYNETVSKGKELILSLAGINHDLAVKEKDIDKFYDVKDGKTVYNEKHPEIEKFKKGLGAIQDYCGRLGIYYDKALEMGAESLYGMVAPKLGLPVAFNTRDRDKKISAEARISALKPFVKSGGDRALSEHSEAAAEKKRSAPEGDIEEGGYFLKKLATDGKYYEQCCETVPQGVDYETHLKRVDSLANRGRSLVKQQPKNK